MTNTVLFPGLGLEFTLNRIAFSVFGKPIYWYAIIIVAGFLLAWLYCSRKAPQFGVTSDDLVDLLIFAVPAALIGARLYYVIFYLDLFRNEAGKLDFLQMFRMWDGGVAIYGAIIAGVLVLFLTCKHKKIPFLAFADLMVYGLLIGQLVGRWGNFVNVEAYGGTTTAPWRMCSPKIAGELFGQGLVDAQGYQQVLDGVLGVHPTFFYESIWNLVGLVVLILLAKYWRRFDGQMFFSYLTWYGIGRGIIEGLRTDSLYFFQTNLRISQVLGFGSALVGLGFLLYFLVVRKKPPELLWINQRKIKLEEEDEKDGGDHH